MLKYTSVLNYIVSRHQISIFLQESPLKKNLIFVRSAVMKMLTKYVQLFELIVANAKKLVRNANYYLTDVQLDLFQKGLG